MSNINNGVVEVVHANNGGFYGVKIGNDWYSFGKKKPAFDKGAVVSFEFTTNDRGYKNAVESSLEIGGGGAPAPQTRTAKATGTGREDYWANKEVRDIEVQKKIQFQASRNAAIAAFAALQGAGVVNLGKTANKQQDIALALIDELTQRFQEGTDNLGVEVEDTAADDGDFTTEEE